MEQWFHPIVEDEMSRLTWAAPLIASVLLVAGCGGSEAPAGDDVESTTDVAPLELTVPEAQTGRCMVPNVENLRAQDTAFEGVVTAVADGRATLSVEEGFRGVEAGTVNVSAPSQDLQDLLLAVDFEEGQTYLVSSLDGRVSVCGLSGPKDDMLADLYEQAYAS